MAVTETAILRVTADIKDAQSNIEQLARRIESAAARIRNSFANITGAVRNANTQLNGMLSTLSTGFNQANAGAQQFGNNITQSTQNAVTALATVGVVANAAGNQIATAGKKGAQALQNAKKNSADLGNNVFKWRENITQFANGSVNAIARVFRAVARLRTAFFLMITVLAVRPVINFFKSLAEYSGTAAAKFAEFGEMWGRFLSLIGERTGPLLESIFNFITTALGQFIEQLQQSSGFIRTLVEVWDLVADVIKGAANSMILLIDGLRAISYLMQGLGNKLSEWFYKAVSWIADKLNPALAWLKDRLIEVAIGLRLMADEWWAPSWLKDMSSVIERIADSLPKISGFAGDVADASAAEAKKNFALFEHHAKNAVEAAREAIANIGDMFSTSPAAKEFGDRIIKFIDDVKVAYDILIAKGNETRAELLASIAALSAGFIANIKEMKDSLIEFSNAISQALERGFSDTFLAVMEFRFNKFKDILVSTLESIKKAIADFMAQRVVASLLGGLTTGLNALAGGLFPGAGGTADYGAAVIETPGGFNTVPVGSPASLTTTFPVSRTPLPSGGGGGGTINIYALDTQDVYKALVKNRKAVLDIINEGGSGGDMQTRQLMGRRG